MDYKTEFLVRNLYYYQTKHNKIFIGEKIDDDTVYFMTSDKYVPIEFTRPLVRFDGNIGLLVLNVKKRVASRLPYCHFDETTTLNDIQYYEKALSYHSYKNNGKEY